MTTKISCLWDIYSIFFNWIDISWCLSQQIPSIVHETDDKHHEMLHCSHCYFQSIDGQNSEFVLFMSIKCTNLHIWDPTCFNVVDILQYSSSRSLTKLTQDIVRNCSEKDHSPQPAGNHSQSRMRSTPWHHQATEHILGLWNRQCPGPWNHWHLGISIEGGSADTKRHTHIIQWRDRAMDEGLCGSRDGCRKKVSARWSDSN